MKINGTFEVALSPEDLTINNQANQFARLSFSKTFNGTLNAQSSGEMLSVRTPVEGSAGYVAIEQVIGSLDDKTGEFALMHFGSMAAGQEVLNLIVVPNSGTEQLTGLSGTMLITIVDGQHFYEFDYQINN